MTTPARLLSLATASPPHIIDQHDAAVACERLFAGRYREFERLSAVFGTTGIRQRQSVNSIEWFFEPRGWPERTAAYLEGAEALFVDCATKALETAGVGGVGDRRHRHRLLHRHRDAERLEARVMTRMGFRNDVQRVPVFGLGCAGGVSGLSLADRLARANPGSKVLFVTIEIRTLGVPPRRTVQGQRRLLPALFGDVALLACVISTEGKSPLTIEGAGEYTAGTTPSTSWAGMSTRRASA